MVSRFLSVRQPAAAFAAGLIAIDRSADDEVVIGGLENVLPKEHRRQGLRLPPVGALIGTAACTVNDFRTGFGA